MHFFIPRWKLLHKHCVFTSHITPVILPCALGSNPCYSLHFFGVCIMSLSLDTLPGLCPFSCSNFFSTWDFCTHRCTMNIYEVKLSCPISIQEIFDPFVQIIWNIPFPTEVVEPLDYCSLFPSKRVNTCVMLISSKPKLLRPHNSVSVLDGLYHRGLSQLTPVNTPILVAVTTPLPLTFKFCLNGH